MLRAQLFPLESKTFLTLFILGVIVRKQTISRIKKLKMWGIWKEFDIVALLIFMGNSNYTAKHNFDKLI